MLTVAAAVAGCVALIVLIGTIVVVNDDSDDTTTAYRTTTSTPRPTYGDDGGGTTTTRTTAPTPTAPPRPDASRVALRVSKPITQPACDGMGIVVLRNAVTPGKYDAEIQRGLDDFPDASYLRTDHSCPSLRQVSDEGTPIYAVYRPAGRTQAEVCAAVRRAGGDAYGKWLDTVTDPRSLMTC